MNIFNKGDQVHWSSQSNGTNLIKSGIVIAIIKAGECPPVPQNYLKTHRVQYAGIRPRNHTSYLIEVKRYSKKGKELEKPFIYWPKTGDLQQGRFVPSHQ